MWRRRQAERGLPSTPRGRGVAHDLDDALLNRVRPKPEDRRRDLIAKAPSR
jgi:hypothetical protein